jgi:hypothetical protein
MDRFEACRGLSDDQLTTAVNALAAAGRQADADLVAHLGEFAHRKLAERKGFRSVFDYCVQKLRMGEAIAYWRIQAAIAAYDFHELIDHIETGELNVTTVRLIAPYLKKSNHRAIIDAARGKTRKEVEAYVASLHPSEPRRDVIVKCGPAVIAKAQWPEPAATAPGADGGAAGDSAAAEQRALDVVEAIDAERRRLHFDVGPDTAQLLERAREILRHKFPFASLEDIVREALNVLLDHKDLDRDDGTAEGTPGEGAAESRNIPMWVRRAVWRRDGGRCVFVGEEGRTCGERSWLEFDHVVPFAKGGRSDDPANVRLLCRAHNRAAADRAWGAA